MPSLSGTSRRRILVADDVEVNRTMVAGILTAADFDVDTVADGREAVGALLSTPYDLVLMDLDMPGLDGYQACNAIREMRNRTGLAIVAFSVRNNPQDRAKSKAAGMDDHIARPIAPKALIQRVVGILARNATPTINDPNVILCRETFGDLIALLGTVRIGAFVSLLAGRLVVMRGVLENAEVINEDIRRHAHDLASSAGMLGFSEVSRCCQAIARPSDTDDRLARLLEAIDRAILLIDGMHEHDQARVMNG